jgi:glucokinase
VADWLAKDMQAGDPAAAISRAAQTGRDALCEEALSLFVRLYAVEAGNLALKMMASGGLYIGGGIAPKILEQLEGGAFMAAFRAKGRMQGLLEQMPVRVILNDRTALYGPAVFAGDTPRDR